jgi:hypothetical protein
MSNWLKKFVDNKIEIASQLHRGECGGSYFESILIFSSVISGIASEIWPGQNIDRKRFVELIVRYSDSSLNSKNISIPLIIEHLESESQIEISSKLKSTFLNYSIDRVLLGCEVDCDEELVLNIVPTLNSIIIREFSYPNLFYKEVRSSIVHEYQTSLSASSHPMTKKSAYISYVNYAHPPSRKIFFHFDWLVDILHSITCSLEHKIDSSPFKLPNEWWIDG